VLPGDLALLYESWWKTRRSVVYTMAPDRREEGKTVLFDRWAGCGSAWRRTAQAVFYGTAWQGALHSMA
jgi:hypothetical protein